LRITFVISENISIFYIKRVLHYYIVNTFRYSITFLTTGLQIWQDENLFFIFQ